MKFHILHNLREEPWGGGNQFLKALRDAWRHQNIYSESPEEADVILINSYPFGAEWLFGKLWRLKRAHPEKIVIYRLNGPISVIRGKDRDVDHIIRLWNDVIADGIIFQSRWCQQKNHEEFGIDSRYQTVIHNAPDPSIFNPDNRALQDDRIRLIAASWSANLRKGFNVYQFLDEHLDPSRYEMTFVGNSPITFHRIKQLDPVDSRQMAVLFKRHDIFLTASQTDPCSNALIEALSCGLPAVALDDGGHAELVQQGGELFTDFTDVLKKIEQVAEHLDIYRNQLPTFRLSQVSCSYTEFATKIFADTQNAKYVPKKGSFICFLKIKAMIVFWNMKHLGKNMNAVFKTHLGVLLAGVVIIIGLSLYSSDRFMFEFLNAAEARIVDTFQLQSPWHLTTMRHQLFKLTDEFLLPRQTSHATGLDIPVINLSLSAQDVSYFDMAVKTAIKQESLAITQDDVLPVESTDLRKIEVQYDDIIYPAKLGLSGDGQTHWAFYKKSFKVNFTGDTPPNHSEKQRLKIPDDRGFFDPFISQYINQQLGMPTVETTFAMVSLNAVAYGVYLLEEKYDESFLEKNGYPNHLLIKYDNQTVKRASVPLEAFQFHMTYLNDLAMDAFSPEIEENIRSHISNFFTALREGDEENIERFIDRDKMARFEAWRELMGHVHDVQSLNLHLAYNLAQGTFFLIPRHESSIGKINETAWPDDNLFHFIANDPEIMRGKNKWLKKLLSQKESTLQEYDDLIDSYQLLILQDPHITSSSRERRWSIKKSRENLVANFAYLETLMEAYPPSEITESESIDTLAQTLTIEPLTFFRTQENQYLLPPGTYTLNETQILPAGYRFIFSPGVRLFLGQDVSLLSYSPVSIKGTEYLPVVITKQTEAEHFGIIAVQGSHSADCQSDITSLDLWGGSEAFIEGTFYRGGLNVYYCDLEMRHSRIHDNFADDGINVKKGTVVLENNQFFDNAFDQVDLDETHASVIDNQFWSQHPQENGDGLDISWSHIIAKRNTFEGFQDKGISVGEQTQVWIKNNQIRNNTIGIAVKDLSRVWIENGLFTENVTDLALYKKKPIFGGGTAILPQHLKDTLSTLKGIYSRIDYIEKDAFQNQIQETFYDQD